MVVVTAEIFEVLFFANFVVMVESLFLLWRVSSADNIADNDVDSYIVVQINEIYWFRLEKEPKDFPRKVLEAIHMRKKGPNLNRDKGLDLDPVWDNLINPTKTRGTRTDHL